MNAFKHNDKQLDGERGSQKEKMISESDKRDIVKITAKREKS